MTNDKPLTVTRADRDAAEKWCSQIEGEGPVMSLPEAFAKHRSAPAPSQHSELADRLEELVANASPLPWSAKSIPYDGYEDPVIYDRDGVYVAQTVYDMQSLTQIHPIEDDTALIVEAVNSLPAILSVIRQSPQDTARRDAVIEECAKVADAEQWPKAHVEASFRDGNGDPDVYNQACRDIAAVIRALATKDADDSHDPFKHEGYDDE